MKKKLGSSWLLLIIVLVALIVIPNYYPVNANIKSYEPLAKMGESVLEADQSVRLTPSIKRALPPMRSTARTSDVPCNILSVTEQGVICDGQRLDFPQVQLESVLSGESRFPSNSKMIYSPKKTIDGVQYSNVILVLRWEPCTPDFLQVYLDRYLSYWEGRVPYHLAWSSHYELCDFDDCDGIYKEGRVVPADVKGLPSDLAADIDYNGVPTAFWNGSVEK